MAGSASQIKIPVSSEAGRPAALITGEKVKIQPNGRYEISGLKIDISGGADQRRMVIAAPAFFWDAKANAGDSAKELTLHAADRGLELTGVGFRFEGAASHLVVSNDVRAIISRADAAGLSTSNLAKTFNTSSTSSTNTTISRGNKTNGPIEVRSRTVDFLPERAIFQGEVIATGDDATLHADQLTGKFAQGNGGIQVAEAAGHAEFSRGDLKTSSGYALYSLAEDRVTLTNHATWSLGNQSGEGDLIQIENKGGKLLVTGNVSVALAGGNIQAMNWLGSGTTNGVGATNAAGQAAHPLRITAQTLSYENNAATFVGAVKVTDPSNGAAMECARLNCLLEGPNGKLAALSAEGGVAFTQGEIHMEADHLNYSVAAGLVDWVGAPSWRLPQGEGKSKNLTVDSTKREMRASGGVSMKLHGAAMNLPTLGGNTNSAKAAGGGASSEFVVQSESLVSKPDSSIFLGKVRVVSAAASDRSLESEVLAAFFGAGKKLEALVAEENVLWRDGPLQATGQRAAYSVLPATLDLTGKPRIESPGIVQRADEFVVHLASKTFESIGAWSDEIDPEAYHSGGAEGVGNKIQ